MDDGFLETYTKAKGLPNTVMVNQNGVVVKPLNTFLETMAAAQERGANPLDDKWAIKDTEFFG